MSKRYRRRSAAVSIANDTAYIANRLSTGGALAFGAVSFLIFYWAIPTFVLHQIATSQSTLLRPLLEAAIAHRIHWSQYVGIALGLICLITAIWKFFVFEPFDREEERGLSLFARIISRLIG